MIITIDTLWTRSPRFLDPTFKYEIKKPPTQMPSRTKAKGVCNRGFFVGAVNFFKKKLHFWSFAPKNVTSPDRGAGLREKTSPMHFVPSGL